MTSRPIASQFIRCTAGAVQRLSDSFAFRQYVARDEREATGWRREPTSACCSSRSRCWIIERNIRTHLRRSYKDQSSSLIEELTIRFDITKPHKILQNFTQRGRTYPPA